jgi:hypothetical protein
MQFWIDRNHDGVKGQIFILGWLIMIRIGLGWAWLKQFVFS